MDLSKNSDFCLNEKQLVDRLKNGDPGSFEFIVREYGSYILTISKRYLASEADAQDAVQDTYIQAFRAIGHFEGRSSLKSWLHRIAVNVALMKIRSNKRRPVELMTDNSTLFDVNGKRIETATAITLSLEDVTANNNQREMIKAQINNLPETAKNILLLRDIEGYSTEEVSKLLDISLSSVKTGLHRARQTLKKKLEHQLR
jgi:RNA polymerase sigma-70 factor (ECF subfamily)